MDEKQPPTTFEEYAAGFAPEVQERLRQMRAAVRAGAPEAGEEINYGVPTFILKGKKVVHFGASKKHIGFYPTPSAVEHFADEFSKYDGAKGSVQFPFDQPLPLDLVTRVAAWRVEQVSAPKKK